jgi:hypothetical protein
VIPAPIVLRAQTVAPESEFEIEWISLSSIRFSCGGVNLEKISSEESNASKYERWGRVD